jgi:class 3 adenylate cyclase/DNA-binding CsgD family transcriptional regulator
MADEPLGAPPLPLRGLAPDVFVGRREELGWLAGALQDSMSGRPRVVLLRGEAGIGKTRLLQELRRVALRSDVATCLGRAYEDVAIPYLPFEPLFEEISRRALHASPSVTGDLTLVRGLLRGGTERAPRGGGRRGSESRLEALDVFPAASRATLELARRRPTLVILDDLHWADQPSIHLFAHLVFGALDAGLQGPLRLMLVAAHRPLDPTHRLAPVLARIEREAVACTLEVGGLREPELVELVEGMTLARPAQGLISTVSRATRGNPLYVREVILSLAKRGLVHDHHGRLEADATLEDLHVPDQITKAVAARAENLTVECRRALYLASFLGDRFSLQHLASLGGWAEDPLIDLLQDAVRHGFLAMEGDGFAFDHSLVRQAFQADTHARRRRRVHAQIAELLMGEASEVGEPPSREIAHHLIAAGDVATPDRVAHHARLAGDRARDALDHVEASEFYEAALAAAERIPDFPRAERARLHHLAGLMRRDNGDAEGCLSHLDRAIALYETLEDVTGVARATVDQAEARQGMRFVPYGSEVDASHLIEVAERVGDSDPRLRAHVWASTAAIYFTARHPSEARALALRALESGRTLGDPQLCATASGNLAMAEYQCLELREAIESFRQCVAYARDAGDRRKEGHALQRLPLVLTWLGRLAEARAMADQACDLAATIHDWAGRSHAQAVLASVALARGEMDAVARHAHETMTLFRRSSYPWGCALVLPALAAARALRGEWREANDALDALVEPGRVFEEPGPAVRLLTGLQRRLIEVRQGDFSEARAFLATQDAPDLTPWRLDPYALQGVCALAELADRLEHRALAAAVRPIVAEAVERGMLFSAGWVFLLPRILGVLASRLDDWEDAERWFEHANDVARREDAAPELVQTALDHARMLRRRGRPEDDARATALLEEALRLAQTQGFLGLVQEARAAGAERADREVTPAPSEEAGLLPAELAVLHLLARGHGEAAIAEELVLGARTVAERLRSVRAKTRIGDRAEALAYILEHGGKGSLCGPELWSGVPRSGAETETAAGWALPMPRLRVLFVSDMEAMTVLLQRAGDAGAREVLRAHNAIIRDCLRAHAGVELQHTGDGFIAILRSARDAIACAIDVQLALAAWRRAHPEQPLHVRIGLHAGEALPEEGRLIGTAVNATVRICATAKADTILASDAILRFAGDDTCVFVDRGLHPLKGIDAAFRLHEITWSPEGDSPSNGHE